MSELYNGSLMFHSTNDEFENENRGIALRMEWMGKNVYIPFEGEIKAFHPPQYILRKRSTKGYYMNELLSADIDKSLF